MQVDACAIQEPRLRISIFSGRKIRGETGGYTPLRLHGKPLMAEDTSRSICRSFGAGYRRRIQENTENTEEDQNLQISKRKLVEIDIRNLRIGGRCF